MRAFLRVGFWFVSCICSLSAACYAHPLGNFTINHLAKIVARDGRMHVRYVLDIAEIPTFQIMHASSNADTWTKEQLDSWAHSEVPTIRNGFELDVDGHASKLVLDDVNARTRSGAGGLPLLYWVADFHVPVMPGAHIVRINDRVYADRRIGWKDVVVAPEREPTDELLHYPSALIGSPRRIDIVSFNLDANERTSAIVAGASNDETPDAAYGSTSMIRSNALSTMFSSSNRAPIFVILTALVAFGLGALHAIEPGHGKALLAFTLVGSRATVRQAAILAGALTFAHTIGVLILGVVLFFAAGFVSESIYPWITLVSGIAVAIIGARNLARYLRRRHVHESGHVHAHDGLSEHHHGDGNERHSHQIPGTGPIDFRGAVVAAMSGGVAPCPAAIVVMLAALRLHQLGYGIVLIVIFSMGLASVLTALGIAVVHGSAWVSRSGRFDRLIAYGPLISAALISLVGAFMVAQGFIAQGVHASLWLLAGFVVLAIGGYALTPQHGHKHQVEA